MFVRPKHLRRVLAAAAEYFLLYHTLKQAPLPSGWEERTAASGRLYYVCHHTRTSQVCARMRVRVRARPREKIAS